MQNTDRKCHSRDTFLHGHAVVPLQYNSRDIEDAGQACGGLCFSSGLYHLLTHTCFKALLFLGAGSVIHTVGGEQDLRKLGELSALLLISYLGLLIGSLSSMGFPGFYSKDMIVEGIGGQYIYGAFIG